VPESGSYSPFTGQVLILLGAVLWGTSGTVQTLAPAAATPPVIGTIRILLSGLLLSAAAFLRGDFSDWRAFLRPIFLLTGLCQALFQVSYFSGIAYTGVAVGTMVAIGSCPIFSGILGVVFDREKLSTLWITATSIAIVGLILLTLDTGESVRFDSRGIIFALTAGFSYSLFTLLARRLIQSHTSDSIIGLSFLIGTIYLLPFLFIMQTGWIFGSVRGILTVAYLGFISAALAYMLYGRGLKYVKVSTTGTLTLAEPLTAALLGIFFVGEELSLLSGIGIIAIFASQILIVIQGKNRTGEYTPPPVG